MAKDRNFIGWYKKSIEAFRPTPPSDSWDNVNHLLDVEEVWGNIRSDLDSSATIARFHRYSMYAERTAFVFLLLALLNFVGLKGVNQQSTTENTSNFGEQITTESTAQPQQRLQALNVSDTSEKEVEKNPLVPNNNLAENSEEYRYSNKDLENSDAIEEGGEAEQFPKKEFIASQNGYSPEPDQPRMQSTDHLSFLNPLFPDLSVLYFASLSEEQPAERIERQELPQDTSAWEKDKNRKKSAITIGLHGAFKNHWLLNRTTFTGLSSEGLTTTLPSFGKELGLLAGIDLNRRINVQAEIAYSEEGQKYEDYINGQYTKKSIDLQYYNLALLLKYRLSPFILPLKSSSSSILLGMYGGILSKAEEQTRNVPRNVLNEYKTFDAGFLAGYEYEFFASKSIIIATGFRVKYGLTNIYSGNGNIPSTFNVTRNGSFDINLGLKYLLQGK